MSTKEIPLTIHYVPCAICLERTPTYPIKYSPRSVNSIQTCISQAAMTTFTFLFALTSRYIVLRTIQMKINIKCCLTVYSHFLCRTFRYIYLCVVVAKLYGFPSHSMLHSCTFRHLNLLLFLI